MNVPHDDATANINAPNNDPAIIAIKPLSSKKINFGTYGYTIRRAKGKGAKGLAVTRNVKLAKGA